MYHHIKYHLLLPAAALAFLSQEKKREVKSIRSHLYAYVMYLCSSTLLVVSTMVIQVVVGSCGSSSMYYLLFLYVCVVVVVGIFIVGYYYIIIILLLLFVESSVARTRHNPNQEVYKHQTFPSQ